MSVQQKFVFALAPFLPLFFISFPGPFTKSVLECDCELLVVVEEMIKLIKKCVVHNGMRPN